MSRENVETMRRAVEALERGGVEALLEFVDPEFETSTPPELTLEPATYRGHEGLRRYFVEFYEVMDEVRFEADEFIDAGDQVVIPSRLAVRGRGTGIEVAQRVTMIWRLRGGRAVGVDAYATKEDALAALDPPPD